MPVTLRRQSKNDNKSSAKRCSGKRRLQQESLITAKSTEGMTMIINQQVQLEVQKERRSPLRERCPHNLKRSTFPIVIIPGSIYSTFFFSF
ncbi:hypothetical protein VTN00DRAFT_3555 [Thermoascus crustaceus]|uniref:uncharacterized protein n=1 Tax=Thermoascus crustaceus TaxID=5088 RepID=UPI003742BAD3